MSEAERLDCTRLRVGQGENCVVLLDDPGVTTPREAEELGLALIRAADCSRVVVELNADQAARGRSNEG